MSSSMVYGNFDSEDVKEERICKPIGIYSTLKYSGELLVKFTAMYLTCHIR